MAIDATLLTIKKNDILKRIQDHGFNSNEFRWEIEEVSESAGFLASYKEYRVSVLVHIKTELFFQFGRFGTRASPDQGHRVGTFREHSGDWQKIFAALDLWLETVKEEVTATDLWTNALSEKELSEAVLASTTTNEPFTPGEVEFVAEKIEELKQLLLSGESLRSDQQDIVTERLDDLKQSVNRFGKKDWITYCLGALTGIAIQAAFTPDTTRMMFQKAGQLLQPILQAAMRIGQ